MRKAWVMQVRACSSVFMFAEGQHGLQIIYINMAIVHGLLLLISYF